MSNKNSSNLLDLPNEILLNIINKLSFIEVFCSLMNMNQRFNQLALEPLYIRHLDMTVMRMKSFSQYTFSTNDQVLSRICENILPQIHLQVNKLIIEQHSIERILLNVNYPKLYSISFVNFQQEILLKYLTDNSVLRQLLTEQITHLNIDIRTWYCYRKVEDLSILYVCRPRWCDISRIFSILLGLCKRLMSLNFCQLFPERNTSICIHERQQKLVMSETLTKLKINVKDFDDCLHLLDGNLSCLSKLIINVEYIEDGRSPIFNTKKLPKLKYFSLSSIHMTFNYDNRIIPLLHRMINLEYLILFLNVVRSNSTVIDGVQLHDDILIHMPRLNKFIFSVDTRICIETEVNIDIATKEDIQHSFIGKRFGKVQVGSYVYSKPSHSSLQYHIYSLPYQFEYFLNLNNSFQGGMFHKVRYLTMRDNTHHFEHQLFKVICHDFPFLKELIINNKLLQQKKEHSLSLIKFPHLILLNVFEAHDDYAEQFLVDRNIHLPCLLNLCIKFKSLKMVTKNFTNDATRLTCAKIKKLHLDNYNVVFKSEICKNYFPLL